MFVATKQTTGKLSFRPWLITALLAIVVLLIATLAFGTWSAQASTLNQTKSKSDPQTKPGAPTSNASGPDDVFFPVREDFESGQLADTNFVSAVPTCVPGGCGWYVYTDLGAHSGTYSAYSSGISGIADQRLGTVSALPIPADASVATLSFWHRYQFEADEIVGSYYDGGVLELSTNGGSSWFDIGTNFITGGYTATIATGYQNPLLGRSAWSGTSNGAYINVQADLLSFAGESILFRFRQGSDNSGADDGWWIDDVEITLSSSAPCLVPAWDLGAPYPLSISGSAAVEHKGMLYRFGGLDATISYVAQAYRFNPVANTWTQIASLPIGRLRAAAVSDGTYIYILGGRTPSQGITNTLLRYDPVANTYTALASPTVHTEYHAVALLYGKIYRIGGITPSGATASVEVYTISTNTWTTTINYPIALSSLTVVVYRGHIYTAGGYTTIGATLDKTYRYNTNNSTWTDEDIADLPRQRYGSTGGMLNGRWVVAAGVINASTTNNVVAWDPTTDTWSSLTDIPHGEVLSSGDVIGNTLYIVGGSATNNVPSSYTRRYTDLPCAPYLPTPSPTPGGPAPTLCPVQFTDMPSDSTFYSYTRCLACRSIVSGYADGTFRPGNLVTRGQIAKIVSNAANFSDAQSTQTFEDIPTGHTFYTYINRLAIRSIISGYACGGPGEPCSPDNKPYFRSNTNVSRGQLAKIVCRASYCGSLSASEVFADVPPNDTFFDEIGLLYELGSINGYACGGPGEPCGPGNKPYFRPGANVSRGQTVKIVSTTFYPNCQTP